MGVHRALERSSNAGKFRKLEHIVPRSVALGDEDHIREEIESRRLAEQNARMTTGGGSVGLRDIARRAARTALNAFFNDMGLKCHWYWSKVSVAETSDVRYRPHTIANLVCSVQMP
jgi:hypothetical protein